MKPATEIVHLKIWRPKIIPKQFEKAEIQMDEESISMSTASVNFQLY